MGGTCSTLQKDEKCIQNLLENLKGTDHARDLDVVGRIILECILQK
jgi:hypothetical protein